MKTYNASQELIDILLNFGFKDETERYYPDHYPLLKINEYSPRAMKRKFSINSYKDYILFDYTNIKLPNGDSRDTLTEDELKSIIIFHNLSASDRKAWRDSPYGIFDVGKRLEDMKRYPQIYLTALNKRIEVLYIGLKNL